MALTCADCKYHICNGECKQNNCKNKCIKRNIKSVCYNTKCADFEYEGIKYVVAI